VRAQVNVGVAYGSPTRQVEELLLQAAREHPRTLDQPSATVLFTDFGNDALQFRLYTWLRVRDVLDRRLIESDLRHRIDELFRESGVVIAFPQRDVHLDVTRPVPVEWAGAPKAE
jgi:small-conductance mechanosensitive channel